MLKSPAAIYVNWAAYDELSDNVELTEAIAMRQLAELLRLRSLGVRLDYYLMDCYWFARDGAYRSWRRPHWTDGPDRWLDKCGANKVLPGLWFTANTLSKLDCAPAWRDSLSANGTALCCFHGGYMTDFTQALHEWYERGVRAFKFDFADFSAAPESLLRTMLPSEIRAANISAWQGAMKAFRLSHPEALFLAYNGYEERCLQHGTGEPPYKSMDTRWLEVFDAMYCGDPRPADVPCMNFWRSKDIYSDHLAIAYSKNGLPLSRIDNSAFMIGTTGTCYRRGLAAWRGMLLLSLARGGWANTYYGNLELLGQAEAAWFAKAQRIYLDLQATAQFEAFGGMPGERKPYGFSALRSDGGLLAVVNPGQLVAQLKLPASGSMRVLFHEKGFSPKLENDNLVLGPEQLALVGVGSHADSAFDLGIEEDVLIPSASRLLAEFSGGDNQYELEHILATPPASGRLRAIFSQADHGGPVRISGGSLPHGKRLGQILEITAEQNGRKIAVDIRYDKTIWSGLSWAVGEVDCSSLEPDSPMRIRFATADRRGLRIKGEIYHVHY